MGRVVILLLGSVEHLLVLLFIGLWFALPRYPYPYPCPYPCPYLPLPLPLPLSLAQTLTRFALPRYPRWVRLTLARREYEGRTLLSSARAATPVGAVRG